MPGRIGKWLAVLLAAGLCVLLVRRCGVSLLKIPGDGERPVFMAGDRVAVCKWSYGLRLSPMRWWGYVRWGEARPERGDWLAFNNPSGGSDSTYVDEQDIFVGFCYAIPGDSLWIDSKGRVFRHRPRDGRPCKTVEVPRKDAYVAITPDNIQWYNHVINTHEGLHSAIISDSLCVSGHFVSSYRFKHDYYWVSSARADNLADSRTFGFVPDECLIGRIGCVLYSWNADAPWYAPFRISRTLMKVGRENIR